MDILERDDAPLTGEQWAQLDETVVATARKHLVGRRLLPLYGPLGAGMTAVPMPALSGIGEEGPITSSEVEMMPLEEISEDFVMSWQELAQAERMNLPLSFAAAGAAAQALSRKEDAIIFGGSEATGRPGLLTVDGRHELDGADWSEAGALLEGFARAVDALASSGFPGPYAMVMSPGNYALAHRVIKGARTEIQYLKDVAEGGVYATEMIGPEQILVMEPGRSNADLAVGIDMKTAYLGAEEMRHPFRILETMALRVKRANAIAVLG